MDLFKRVPDGHCILSSNGVYKQCDLYEYNGHIYAKLGAGFIGLRESNGSRYTTLAKTFWLDIDISYAVVDHGRLVKGQPKRAK